MGEIIMILLVALLVYGGRLPQVAAAVGRSIGELKRGLRETTDLVRVDLEDLADVDPRRSVRRAWKAPRVVGDGAEGPHPGNRASLPAPEELATEDISEVATSHTSRVPEDTASGDDAPDRGA